MELLKTALVIALLTTTSAKPMGFRRHHDADIPDHKMQHSLHRFTGDAFNSMSSSKSSESGSSEEGGSSSQEDPNPNPDVTTPVTTSTATTTVEEGSTPPPLSTMGTDQTIVMKTTSPPATPTPSVNATSTCVQCFTVLIPTAAPITDNRGDN